MESRNHLESCQGRQEANDYRRPRFPHEPMRISYSGSVHQFNKLWKTLHSLVASPPLLKLVRTQRSNETTNSISGDALDAFFVISAQVFGVFGEFI